MNNIGLNTNSNNIKFKSVEAFPQQTIPQGYEMQAPQVQIPDMYYTPNEAQQKTFKETIKEADVMNMVYPWFEHPLLMLGTCAGLAWGVDKFAASCGGEYEKSLVGKAAKFGDKLHNSTFIQSKPAQTVIGWGRSAKNKVAHIFRNSDVINAIHKTPSKPQNSLVLHEMLNMKQRMIHEFNRVASTLKIASEGFVELNKLGINKADKQFINDFFKGATQSEEAISNAVQLKRLGCTDAEISKILADKNATSLVKAEYTKKWGITAEKIQELAKSKEITEKDIKLVKEAADKTRNVRIGAGNYKWLGPFQPFARNTGMDEISNRITSLTLGEGARTKTGAFMSKFLQTIHRGFTFGGGKLGVLAFVAPHLVETMMDVKKADPNQKVGTAAHGLVESVSWVFTFPLALKIMHHFAGAQYAGMSEENIKKVREIKEKFNNTKFDSYQAWKDELKLRKAEVKALEKVEGQNLLTKISRKIGKFVTIDLERFKSFRNGGAVGNTVRKIPGAFKNIAGVPMRLGIWGVLSMGVLGGALTKGTKAIFGNYYDRYKEEEHETKKKGQKEFLKQDLQQRLVQAQAEKIAAAQGLNQSQVETKENKQNNGAVVPPPAIAERINPNKPMPAEILAQANNSETQVENSTKLDNSAIDEEKKTETATENLTKNEEPTEVKNLLTTSETNNNPQNTAYTPAVNEIGETVPQQIVQNDKTNPTITPAKNFSQTQKLENISKKRDNYTYIPSSENLIKDDKKQNETNKYIPSQLAANFTKNFDNSGLEGALRRADRAEQKALQILSGKFNGM